MTFEKSRHDLKLNAHMKVQTLITSCWNRKARLRGQVAAHEEPPVVQFGGEIASDILQPQARADQAINPKLVFIGLVIAHPTCVDKTDRVQAGLQRRHVDFG